MSRFYGNLANNRSTITKCGHKDGLVSHVRGWNLGIMIEAYVNEFGKDAFRVYKTSGSNNKKSLKQLFTISERGKNESI